MNRPSILPFLRIACVCLPAFALSPLLPQQFALAADAAADSNTVSLNFVNADIGAVIQAVAKISGRNFIIDPRVKGTLNIVTARPVAKSLTYGILLSALRLQGYAAVESRGLTKIVPEADAKLHGPPVSSGRPAASGDQISTQVFQIHHESAAQLVAVIRPLVSPNNTVTAYAANNTLVVTDYAENLSRIGHILESIDVPQGDVRVLPVQHASALDLAATLNRLLNDGSNTGINQGDTSQRVSIVADARTNNLLVRTENLSRLAAVRSLVQTLDLPGSAGNIHVIYLKNAEAAKVAQTLRAVLSGDTSTPSGNTANSNQGGSSGFASSGNTPTTNAQGNFSSTSSGQSTTGGGLVQADVLNNALIITAPEAIYNNLRRVAEQLDRRRAQVYVEALIAEVSTERAAESGIQWLVGAAAGNGAKSVGIIGGSNFSTGSNNLNQLITSAASGSPQLPGSGVNVALAAGTVTVPGVGQIPSLAVLAHFLETESKANILSTPNIVTLDNEEAKIVIGRNVPFVTGQYTNTGGGTTVANPFQTIERKDVGLTLKIKPQISEGGTVRLQIYQEASSVIDATALSSAGPSTTKRSIESSVLVDDGAIIALGGLVEDSYSGGEEKIPVLGDIPVAGALFRYDTRKRTKTNLVVFLRPRILRDADSYGGLTGDRYDYIIDQQRSMERGAKLMRNEPPTPLLPSLQPSLTLTPPSADREAPANGASDAATSRAVSQ